jgi:hypothetical protein
MAPGGRNAFEGCFVYTTLSGRKQWWMGGSDTNPEKSAFDVLMTWTLNNTSDESHQFWYVPDGAEGGSELATAVSYPTIPIVRGLTAAQARQSIAAIGYRVGNVQLVNDPLPAGQVVRTAPAGGPPPGPDNRPASPDVPIIIFVSKGPGN